MDLRRTGSQSSGQRAQKTVTKTRTGVTVGSRERAGVGAIRERWGGSPGFRKSSIRSYEDSGLNFVTAPIRKHHFTFSRRDAPEVLPSASPSETRGRRESRVRAAPAVPCAIAQESAHTSIQVQRRASGFPCAVVYGL